MKKWQYTEIQSMLAAVAGYFNLDVEVWIEVEKLGEGHHAEVSNLGGGVYVIHFDKDWLKSADRDDILCVTAHEMVHVKQYELDNLTLSEAGYFMNSKEYKGDYWFSPWEIEARGYEQAFLHYSISWTK